MYLATLCWPCFYLFHRNSTWKCQDLFRVNRMELFGIDEKHLEERWEMRCWPVVTSRHRSSPLQDLLAEAPHRDNKERARICTYYVFRFVQISDVFFCSLRIFAQLWKFEMFRYWRILWPGVPRGIWWHRWTKVVRTWLKEVPRWVPPFSEGLRITICRSWKWLRVTYQIITSFKPSLANWVVQAVVLGDTLTAEKDFADSCFLQMCNSAFALMSTLSKPMKLLGSQLTGSSYWTTVLTSVHYTLDHTFLRFIRVH